MEGKIHSIESMGLVDGPGIRTVVFMQGCDLRCKFCHNPDTWAMDSSQVKRMTPGQLVEKVQRFRPYYGQEGGVTFSGGEPLLQPEFLEEGLSLLKEVGIHTCLDTAGVGMEDYDYTEILRNTDLVLLDIKQVTSEKYQEMTGKSWDRFQAFQKLLKKMGTPVWIRHVMVPGLTFGEAHVKELEAYLKDIPNIQKVELLPYHVLGVHKYQKLGIHYPLENVRAVAMEEVADWERRLNQSIVINQSTG